LSDIEKYDTLYDNLIPVVYKYNNGTSGRFHTGLTTQNVLNAINISGLTTQDVAAYCKWQDLSGEESGIRYEEFVSVNIFQIQKLKSRTSTIEEKLLAYESRIKTLETQLQNLQNS
jgi:hypothetical protein